MMTWSGLFGQTLAHNGYAWTDVSMYYWHEGTNASGTGQTYLDAFIREENPYNLSTDERSGSFPVYHYRQNLDGTYSIENRETAYLTVSGSTTFTLTNKFEGYTVHSASKGQNGFNPNGGTVYSTGQLSVSSSDRALHIYHTRNTYQFQFDVNYPDNPAVTYSQGRSENRNEIVKYEMPLNVFGRTISGNISH